MNIKWEKEGTVGVEIAECGKFRYIISPTACECHKNGFIAIEVRLNNPDPALIDFFDTLEEAKQAVSDIEDKKYEKEMLDSLTKGE